MDPAAVLSVLVKTDGAATAAAQLTKLEGAARKTSNAADRSAASLAKSGAAARTAASGFSLAAASAKQTGHSVEGLARTIGRVARVGGIAGALGIAKVVKDGIAFNATMEQNRIAFTGFLGSTKAANKELRSLYQLAKTTPFEFTDVTLASRKLMAMGFTVKEANKELRLLADAASGAALGADGINRMVLALGQIKSKGVLQMEDLRQLQELGVINFKQLGADLGLTAKELGNVGKVGVPAAAAIEAINRQFAGPMFAGQSAKQAQTLNGQISTLRDNYKQFAGSLTTTAFDASKTIFGKLNKAISDINAEFRANPKLTLSAKIEIAKEKLLPVAQEIAGAIGEQLRNAHIGDKIVAALNAAIPVIAKAAGKLGLAAVKAFAKAFVEGDPLTQLALGAFFITKFVGWKNIFRKLGAMMAAEFAVGVAAGETAGLLVSAAKWGRMFAARFILVASVALAGWEIGKALRKYVKPVRDIGDFLGNTFGEAVFGSAESRAVKFFNKLQDMSNQFTSNINTVIGTVNSTLKSVLPKTGRGQGGPTGAGRPDTRGRYQSMTLAAAKRAGIDPNFFYRQINQESGFNPTAKSPMGALGIAQFMPGTARGLGVNPLDPKAALNAAAKLMASYIKKYGSWRDALVAYNAGPGRVGGALPAETQKYVASILGGGGKGGGAGGRIKYTPLGGGGGASTKGKLPVQIEGMSLDSAIGWINKNFRNVTAFVEDRGGGNQHLHINSANHAQIRAIAKGLSKMGFDVGEYGGKPIPGVGGITTLKHKHYGAADHYHGGAIDVNADTQLIRAFNVAGTKPDNIFKAPSIKQTDFMAFIQKRLSHFDLMVRAGLISATKAVLKKRAAIAATLPSLTGDTRLEALAMLRELPKAKTAAQKTWTPQAKQRLAMAIIQANPGNVANLPAGVLKAAGPAATMQNPWMQAFQTNLSNQVGAGVITQAQADKSLAEVLTRSLPFLTGQDAADARTTLFQIAQNTKDTARAALDTANGLRASAISDAGFLGGLTGPAAEAVKAALAPYGLGALPGGGNIAEIGNSAAAVGLAQNDLAALMAEVNAGEVALADVWSQIISDLGVIASGAEASTEASNAATEAVDALTAEVKRQTDFAASAVATESGAMARWVTEVISKQMGFDISGRAQTPGYGVGRRS